MVTEKAGAPKFKVGDIVSYLPATLHSRNAARGAYEVVRVMPNEKGIAAYRIRSSLEEHERVAEESELAK